MDPETGVVTDSTYRVPKDPAVEAKYKKYSAEKLARAAEREEKLLNTPNIIDKLLDGIDAISKKLKQRKKANIKSTDKQR